MSPSSRSRRISHDIRVCAEFVKTTHKCHMRALECLSLERFNPDAARSELYIAQFSNDAVIGAVRDLAKNAIKADENQNRLIGIISTLLEQLEGVGTDTASIRAEIAQITPFFRKAPPLSLVTFGRSLD